MARKTLADQSLAKMSLIANVANVSKDFNSISENTKISDMTEEQKNSIITVSGDMLIEDPDNSEVYGELEVEALSRDMKTYGFQGVILAYPYKNKYKIESGHRRKAAAILAGLSEFTVFVTSPPSTEWERKLRLHRANIHNRKYSPMIMAKMAQSLFEAHQEEITYKKNNNLLTEGEITDLNELVGMDLEKSRRVILKYRALLNLTPNLQQLADSEEYSWSGLSAASVLNEEKQYILYHLILDKSKKYGPQSIKRTWLDKKITDLKLSESVEELNTLQQEDDENKTTRNRRRNGTKIVMKNAQILNEILTNEAIYKKEEIPAVVETLNALKISIEKKLEDFKQKKV